MNFLLFIAVVVIVILAAVAYANRSDITVPLLRKKILSKKNDLSNVEEKIGNEVEVNTHQISLEDIVANRIKSAIDKKLHLQFQEIWISTKNFPHWIKTGDVPSFINEAREYSSKEYELQTIWGRFRIKHKKSDVRRDDEKPECEINLLIDNEEVLAIILENGYTKRQEMEDERKFWTQPYNWNLKKIVAYIPGLWEEKLKALHDSLQEDRVNKERERKLKIETNKDKEVKKRFGIKD